MKMRKGIIEQLLRQASQNNKLLIVVRCELCEGPPPSITDDEVFVTM